MNQRSQIIVPNKRYVILTAWLYPRFNLRVDSKSKWHHFTYSARFIDNLSILVVSANSTHDQTCAELNYPPYNVFLCLLGSRDIHAVGFRAHGHP